MDFEDYIGKVVDVSYPNGHAYGVLKSIEDGWMTIASGEELFSLGEGVFVPNGGIAKVLADSVCAIKV